MRFLRCQVIRKSILHPSASEDSVIPSEGRMPESREPYPAQEFGERPSNFSRGARSVVWRGRALARVRFCKTGERRAKELQRGLLNAAPRFNPVQIVSDKEISRQ